MIPVNLFALGAQAGPKSYDVRKHHCRCDPTVAARAPLVQAFAEVPMLYGTDVELAYHEDQGRDTRPICQSVWSDRRWSTTWIIPPSIAATTLPEGFKKTIWVTRRPGRHGRGKTVNRFRYASVRCCGFPYYPHRGPTCNRICYADRATQSLASGRQVCGC
jgi:hypothetical protein